VLRTRDPEAARAFFGEGLGLRLALDREFPAWGARLLFFRVGGVTVEVAAELGSAPAPEEATDSLGSPGAWATPTPRARASQPQASTSPRCAPAGAPGRASRAFATAPTACRR